MFTTSRPCFGCTKEMLQAVYFVHDWTPATDELKHEYERLQNAFGGRGGIRQLNVTDPDAAWAIPRGAPPPDETGHEAPTAPAELPADLKERLAGDQMSTSPGEAAAPPDARS